jgi:hypothetical protein
MSTAFNEDNYLKKLDNVQPTQDNIQALSLWIIHHKNNHETITKLWLRKLKESMYLTCQSPYEKILILHLLAQIATNPKAALTLFYLANDVIQNCKRKNAKIFQDSFKYCILNGIALMRYVYARRNGLWTANVCNMRLTSTVFYVVVAATRRLGKMSNARSTCGKNAMCTTTSLSKSSLNYSIQAIVARPI